MPDFAAGNRGAEGAAVPTPSPARRPTEPLSGVLTERMGRGADWLEQLDPQRIREDVEHGIRAHPLLSVTLAVCAGFLLGRLLRH